MADRIRSIAVGTITIYHGLGNRETVPVYAARELLMPQQTYVTQVLVKQHATNSLEWRDVEREDHMELAESMYQASRLPYPPEEVELQPKEPKRRTILVETPHANRPSG